MRLLNQVSLKFKPMVILKKSSRKRLFLVDPRITYSPVKNNREVMVTLVPSTFLCILVNGKPNPALKPVSATLLPLILINPELLRYPTLYRILFK